MNRIPEDLLLKLMSMLGFNDIYNLKKVDKCTNEMICLCQSKFTNHQFDEFWKVHVKNINLIGRDFKLNFVPSLAGLMTCKIFHSFFRFFKPNSFLISSSTCTLNLTKYLLKNPQKMNLVIVVDQKNLMTIAKNNVIIDSESIEIIAKDKITIEVCMQLLNLRKQSFTKLVMSGEVNDMNLVASMIPDGLKSLEIIALHGAHDVRSLPLFLDLKLEYLCLNNCFDVCEHPEYINYDAISSQIMRSKRVPNHIALTPFPLKALKWCIDKDIIIDCEKSTFFEFEFELAMRLVAYSPSFNHDLCITQETF